MLILVEEVLISNDSVLGLLILLVDTADDSNAVDVARLGLLRLKVCTSDDNPFVDVAVVDDVNRSEVVALLVLVAPGVIAVVAVAGVVVGVKDVAALLVTTEAVVVVGSVGIGVVEGMGIGEVLAVKEVLTTAAGVEDVEETGVDINVERVSTDVVVVFDVSTVDGRTVDVITGEVLGGVG